jgi:hypothetical protein
MPRPRTIVYLVKHLTWAYNDECTVPHSAQLERAFRDRENAEFYRRELELGIFDRDEDFQDDYEERRGIATNWDEARVLSWLAKYNLATPERNFRGELMWQAEWLFAARTQLGREEFLRFCEMFDREAYTYHIIETEIEL